MVRSLALVRRRPMACLAGAALVAGIAMAGWVLSHRETLLPVSGTVILDGKPLKSGFVTFYPNHSRGNTYPRSFQGKIKDGRYELLTYDKKGAARKGVPLGWYRVVVEGFAAADRGTAAKTSPNSRVVGGFIVQGSPGQKATLTLAPPGTPKDFFSNYNKPQAVEVTKARAEDAYDLALTRPARQQQAARRQ